MTFKSVMGLLVHLMVLAIFAIAGMTIIGWHTGAQDIVQLADDIVPMQYNTSWTHIFAAGALLAAAHSRKRLSLFLAVLVVVASFATGLQYIMNIDFGIDGLFMDPGTQHQTKTAYPGRMAPNTIICFLMIAGALILWNYSRKHEARYNASFLLAALTMAASLTALVGYTFSIEAAYGWWSLSNIAPQTAFLLLLHGIGIAALVSASEKEKIPLSEKWHTAWKPLLAAIIGITITLYVAQSILENQKKRAQDTAEIKANIVMNALSIGLSEKIRNIRRMSARWEVEGGTPPERWVPDAMNYLHDNASYGSIALMDENFDIYLSLPESPETNDIWRKVYPEKDALAQKSAQRKIHIQHAQNQETGSPILVIYEPLYAAGEPDGFLLAAYVPAKELSVMLPESDFHYELYDEEGLLARNYKEHDSYIWFEEHIQEFTLHGKKFRTRITINARVSEDGGMVFSILIAGIFASILLANILYKSAKMQFMAKQIRISEENYALTVNSAGIALWDWDLPGNRIKWSGCAWQLFGLQSNDDVPGGEQEVRSHIPASDEVEVNKAIALSHELKEPFSIEFRLMQPDGRYKWVQSVGRIVEGEGSDVRRMMGIMMDITARKKAEQELMRTNEELEQFAYIASHDLKAPLRGIDNLAKWIAEDLDPVLTTDAREKMDLLRGRVARLEMLLDDILQYSRAGRVVGNVGMIKTGEMVTQIGESIGLAPDFKLEIADDMPELMSAYTPLEQVFLNLMSNARKHHDRAQGTIEVGAVRSGQFYEFYVRDDGPGIPPEFRERVFKMFQTLKPRDDKESSGLGLAIVKKLVEWQGGRIWVSGEGIEGRGATIRFLWPAQFADQNDVKNKEGKA